MKKLEPKEFDYKTALELLHKGLVVGKAGWVTEWLSLDPASGEIHHWNDGVRKDWHPTPEDEAAKWGVR